MKPRGAKAVPCTVCGAEVGESCRGSAYSGRSHRTVQSHTRRVEEAREAKAAEGVVTIEHEHREYVTMPRPPDWPVLDDDDASGPASGRHPGR